MRRYETTYILRPNLGEAQINEIIERTNDIIKNDGGSIIWLEHWGNKKLAYEINKENHGYYIHFDHATLGSTVQEMERIFNIDDRVLRFLTIKTADSIDQQEVEKETENAAAAEAAKASEAEESSTEASSEQASTEQASTEQASSEEASTEEESEDSSKSEAEDKE